MKNLSEVIKNRQIVEQNTKIDEEIARINSEEENRIALIKTKYNLQREQKRKEKQPINCSHDLILEFNLVERLYKTMPYYYCLACKQEQYDFNKNLYPNAIKMPGVYQLDEVKEIIDLAIEVLNSLDVNTELEEVKSILSETLTANLREGKPRS